MYKPKNHSKYSLKVHLVFATKYRTQLKTEHLSGLGGVNESYYSL